ncbi:MAG: glycosyltransferase [Candidatus Cloacimonetes bacterium]|nr:glycosyltransferase [Candidatus Cloacimonadota bacterium]
MGHKRHSLLYIAYHFPPLGGVATLRSLKNVKYLAQLGYKVQVLTVRTALIRRPKDHALLAEIPSSVKVWRAFCPDISWLFKLLWGLKLNTLVQFIQQRLLIPDAEVLWRPFAKRKLRRIIRRHPEIRAAVISSGPPSSLALGLMIKNRYHIPFICDFRDEWTNNPERINQAYPAASQSRELLMEAKVVSAAAGLVYLTKRMRDNFLSSYPFLDTKPSAIIPNGFAEEDFAGLEATSDRQVFHLVYSGSFYGRRQPDPLWRAVLGLIEAGRIDPDKLRVEIQGKNTPAFVLGQYNGHPTLQKIVCFQPFVSHSQSLKTLMRATALLLYIPSGKNAGSVLTGKIFDYLRSGKPILAIVPPGGMAAELVIKAGTGLVADCSDQQGISDKLLKLYQLWQDGDIERLQADQDFISAFSREKLAQALADLIDEVAQ